MGFAQGIQTEFGKNRVQYSRDFDEWVYYESQNFITYWYGEGRMVGQAVVMIAEAEHDGIQRLLEHRVNDKIEIIVYTDLSDLKQSNIGSEEAFTNATGRTKIFGNKILVYFNGDHQDLRTQIREGIAGVYLESMLFGTNLQEYVQNTILFSMPEWFKEGLISYVGNEWDVKADDQLRTMFANERLKDFGAFVKENPELAGRSLWHFLSTQYGSSSIANILYIARIYRDVEEGMLYVLGTPFANVTKSWFAYYQQRYNQERILFESDPGELLKYKNKHNSPVTQMAISPDGRQLAYVLNRIGKVQVFVQDIQTGKRKKVFQNGFRNAFQETDLQYPHIAWHPSSQYLAILYEKQDKIKLLVKDLITDKDEIQDFAPIYQRVYSMHYFDAQRLVITGATSGISDVMIYHLPTRQTERITQDFWDDLDARPFTFNGKKGILFASNRDYTILAPQRLDGVIPTNKLDLFFYNYEDKATSLVRITQTPDANERIPELLDEKWFTWLSDASGITNRYIGYLDSVIIRTDQYYKLPGDSIIRIHGDSLAYLTPPLTFDSTWAEPIYDIWAFGHGNTNAGSLILNQTFGAGKARGFELRKKQGKYVMYPVGIDVEQKVRPAKTYYVAPVIKRNVLPAVPETPKLAHPRKDTVIYYFQTPFDYPVYELKPADEVPKALDQDLQLEESAGLVLPSAPVIPDSISMSPIAQKFITSRIIPSRLKFRLDYITNKFDNTMLFGGLDNFTGRQFLNLDRGQAIFTPPPAGLLIKAAVKDLFEDYEFEGGVRMPTNFRGSEFFLIFSDKKHRWDKQYAIYRGDWSNIFDLNSNVLNGPAHLIPPGLGGPGSPVQYKVRMQSTLGQVQWRYPLDIFRSFRLRTTLRNDRYFWHALEPTTLAFPAVNEQRLGLRAEYVFDNTLPVAPNILNGMRYNLFTEVLKGFRIQPDPFSFELNKAFTGLVGVDFRYYIPLWKHSVLAFRFNGVTSFGQERMLFYLGGVDNWILPQFNTDIPVNSSSYGFQTLAANLRGFKYNIRNGSSFVLTNTEVRIPIVKYILPRTRSTFFRNLQLTGFFDAGTAWEGISPYSDDNPLNIITLENPPSVTLRVKYFRDPLVVGYGFGVRSLLFGYMLKLDYGWGVETRQVQKPILHLSMGMDF